MHNNVSSHIFTFFTIYIYLFCFNVFEPDILICPLFFPIETKVNKRESGQRPEESQTATSRQSTISNVSRPESDTNPALLNVCDISRASLNLANAEHQTQDPSSTAKTSPKNKNDKTLLLDSTMEMTQTHNNEVIVVETKAKKNTGDVTAPSNKADSTHRTGVPHVKRSTVSSKNEIKTSATPHTNEPENNRDQETKKPELFKTASGRDHNSRIPKLGKAVVENCQKTSKNKLKVVVHDTKSKSCEVSTNCEDYFKDSENALNAVSQVQVASEKDMSKITCRRTRTKGRAVTSMTKRQSSLTTPKESSQSEQEQLCGDAVVAEYEEQKQPEEFVFLADKTVCPSIFKPKVPPHSGGGHKPKCRGTFVISVTSGSTFLDSPQACVEKQGKLTLPPSSPDNETQAPSANTAQVLEPQYPDSPQNSCKRRWFSTQDIESSQENMSSENQPEILLQDRDEITGPKFKKPKKARKEEGGRPVKKRRTHKKERDAFLNDGDNANNRSNKGLESAENQKATDVWPGFDANDWEGDQDPTGDVHISESSYCEKTEDGDIFEQICSSKSKKSKSKPKDRRNKSELRAPPERRSPRKTFIIRRTTQEKVSLNNTRMSDLLDVNSPSADTGGQKDGHGFTDMLTEEMPPWSSLDHSIADTEMQSFLNSPGRPASVTEKSVISVETSPGMFLHLLHLFLKILLVKCECIKSLRYNVLDVFMVFVQFDLTFVWRA